MVEFHSINAFAREEPRVELIEDMLKSILSVVDLEFEGRPVQVDGFRLRDPKHWRTVPETSLQQNLGSFSTACNCKCTFCYEDGNPEGLFERQPRFVSLAEAETRQRHFHDGKGVMRESKCFFEPLANPHYVELLELIRAHEPWHVIDVTTNGALITPETVERLAELKPVFVNLSLISASESKRRVLMGDRQAASAIRAIPLLRSHQVPFMGTLVPLPEQGLADVEETVRYLDAHEARIIRVGVPGLSRYHPRYVPGEIEAWVPRLVEHISKLRAVLETPVLISPFAYVSASIEPVVEGVVRGSPAAAAGLSLGDRLLSVDGVELVSRSHAAALLQRAGQAGCVDVEFSRGGTQMRATLREPGIEVDAYPYKPRNDPRVDLPGMAFGVCLPGSFHLQYVRQIYDAIQSRRARRTLVVAAPLLRELAEGLLAQLPLPDDATLDVVVPPNEYFGGTVSIGDLWVLDDIAKAAREYTASHGKPDLLVLPTSFLSRWGRDLRGVPYTDLQSSLDIEIALVQCERIVL